jgi:hypothetical protein
LSNFQGLRGERFRVNPLSGSATRTIRRFASRCAGSAAQAPLGDEIPLTAGPWGCRDEGDEKNSSIGSGFSKEKVTIEKQQINAVIDRADLPQLLEAAPIKARRHCERSEAIQPSRGARRLARFSAPIPQGRGTKPASDFAGGAAGLLRFARNDGCA